MRPRGLTLLALLGLSALALTLGLYDLGGVALVDPDEPRYAESSRQMIERADYIVPYFNGEMRLHKPPLFYWGQVLAFRLFGVGEFAARFPSALAYLALLVATVAFALTEDGWPVALRAGAILLTCPLAFVAGRASITDMTLAFLFCSALFVYYLVDSGRIAARFGSLLVGGLLGGAFLAKGPVGILGPAIVIVAYHGLLREGGRLLRWKGILIGMAAAGAVTLPWLLMIIERVGFETLGRIALRETVERYLSTGLAHAEGAWYHFAALGVGAFPWSIFLLPCYLSGARRALAGHERFTTFLWVWIGALLVFFTLSKGKVPTYILPVLPAAALYLGRAWEDWGRPLARDDTARRRTDREWIASIAMFLPVTVLPFLVAVWVGRQGSEFFTRAYSFLVITAVALVGTVVMSSRKRRRGVVTLLAIAISVFYIYAYALWAEDLERSKSLKPMVAAARLMERKDARLSVYRNDHPSLVYYSERPVSLIESEKELASFLLGPGDAVVVMNDWRLEALGAEWRAVVREIATVDDHVALDLSPRARGEAIDALREAVGGPDAAREGM
jgi:4-amino-4-deoxy-L-arabinose transferase-like glycosyltransferase